MSTIKISQLGNVSAFTDETIIPVVANVAGTLTTLKSDGDTLKTFVLGTVETDIANVAADVATLQGNIVSLTANAATQSGLIAAVNANVAALSAVALSGDYDDLINTPALGNVAITDDYNDLINKPALGNVALSDDYNDLINTPALGNVALSDDYNDLINAPTLSTVATSGDYNDLDNTPTLSNVATSGDYSDLTNTPSLSTVATSGDYNDLDNTPTLSNVAISGDYNDLINTPNVTAIGEAVLGAVETDISNGNITFGNIIPNANVTYSLGSEIAQWKDLYLSGSTIYLGGTAISIVEGNLTVGGVEISGGAPVSLSTLTTVAKTGGDQITPTAIDLTKNVNKLTSGRYTLADGVEGQLMYIVPQHASGAVNMLIEVANADLGIGADTDQELVFKGDGTSQVITLIFTDGAWSQSGGEWAF